MNMLVSARILICFFLTFLFSVCTTVGYAVNVEHDGHHDQFSSKKKISGTVYDSKGDVLVGATIKVKGESEGTVTNVNGEFLLLVNPDATLVVSFLGYESVEVPVSGKTDFKIVLQEDAVMLDDVIVTALGIEKKASSLSYSAMQLKSDELNRVKETNMITALAGKAAGMQVSKNSSGPGASAKVSIRGIRSVVSDNQPLYVIDGVPMLNSTSEQAYSAIGGTADAGNRDGGDGISNLNPEDVESITVLKGAPAAALYGSQAANGVILITTKKGSTGAHKISFSTSLTIDKAFSLPEMQNRYGVSDGVDSWGAQEALPEQDHLNDFFRTGFTSITSLSVSHGNEKLQNYFSYP